MEATLRNRVKDFLISKGLNPKSIVIYDASKHHSHDNTMNLERLMREYADICLTRSNRSPYICSETDKTKECPIAYRTWNNLISTIDKIDEMTDDTVITFSYQEENKTIVSKFTFGFIKQRCYDEIKISL